ncbi:MAG: hypothetical protein A2Y95_05265 [Deltaproteobacteria bacterium RBG_13_65_10]|nr:MAG: hypothetical protein A2Y95_05265 [Deltaproteobacteria bacterium RBG_13_65_10]
MEDFLGSVEEMIKKAMKSGGWIHFDGGGRKQLLAPYPVDCAVEGPIRRKRRSVLGSARAQTRGTDARRGILRVAEEIFARKGYGATSAREIAKTAGVTKGLLFYHFQTKERLYLTVIDNMVKELSRLATPPSGEGIDHMAHVRRFIEGWTDFLVEHRDFQKLITRELMEEGKFHKKIIDEYLKPVYEIGISFIREGIEAGVFRPVDPATVVQMLSSTNSMYFISLPLHERILGEDPIAPAVLARRKEELCAHFLRILQKTP